MTVTTPNDATSAITTMALTLGLQVKRLETERPKTDKVCDEAFQQMQATLHSQQARIAQLEVENRTLLHQSNTKIENLRAKNESLQAALKETLAQLPTVTRDKRFDELTLKELSEVNDCYQFYQNRSLNPNFLRSTSAQVFYSMNRRLVEDYCDFPLWVKESNPLCAKHKLLMEKK